MKKLLFIAAFLVVGLVARAEEKRITTSDGVELYVNIKGKGTPCLYLHGGPGSGSYWLEKFFGDFLEQHFTMIYLDQRGVGRSGSPGDGNYSMERMALDFEEVREALDLKNWLTLGHSFGGLLQMGYAELYPESGKGMLMINCTLDINESFCKSWSPKAAEFLGQAAPDCDKESVDIIEILDIHISGLREKDLFWKMAYADKKNEDLMNTTYGDIPNWNNSFGSAAWDIDDYKRNYKPKTAQVDVPVLFFYGTTDWMVGPEHYKGISFPKMLLWKSEVGHVPFLENRANLEKAVLTFKKNYKF